MLHVFSRLGKRDVATSESLTLPFELRQRSRQRVCLDNGDAAALYLPRGTRLCHGDCLLSDEGLAVAVCAAQERVSTLRCDDPVRLARACYHLGNRHVALQVGSGWARYLHDHVLDDMVRGLGLEVDVGLAPFEPEPGAYQAGHHHHD